jgi:adenylate cyclase
MPEVFRLSPKAKRNIQRIIPFGLIWLLAGWVFMTVEVAAMGTPSPDSDTIINLTFPVLIFASVSVFIVGIFIGAVELLFMENLFRDRSFLQKIIYKFGIYTAILLLITFITYPVAASVESDISLNDHRVWQKFGDFLVSETFASTIVQMTSSLMLCLIYAGVSENLGHGVLVNFFTGKYHKPREEKRIFMFLDMKSSTTIAEKLGHIRYFDLLRDYYSDLSDAIINHLGEVYQYIGDEVVISWNENDGLLNNNCLKCFYSMRRDLQKRADYYQKTYGIIPAFKAGLHLGEVTTGEIGALKKEIFFTGDVLNVTSRIQALCNNYQKDLLISSELADRLGGKNHLNFRSMDNVKLRGRKMPMEIFSVETIGS